MDNFTGFCREVLNERWDGVHHINIDLVFVHSGYVVGGFTLTLAHVEKDRKYLKGDESY